MENSKRTKVGTIVSDKMSKTVVVEVNEQKRHQKYHKAYKFTKRFKAHVEDGEYHVGDKVEIEETKPISKDKHFKVLRKI
ncbi:30S ribosomal protein S17 [Patescibacteria group bacterium]|nr:30S ribosomal protein S17 [Patescibacteria group bacterium]